ncbi:hypothetical protein MLP_50740 [Microlunatus phosphovorus NM-1]|uniref:Uncharacterized protein n=1 Tax=Microlunatus phosphovorus (strain ATCC 700054 / DSM 10555 / JCM 9379 / NBRC 101784 / NCIMB 13414 / VKM Ac-1990 / NM-1) TaxID=1032480 RepID=F5XH80_MICPN|nr:hypothetical protein [Microlunatus phosphovorus]BAK38088.1 hypothetical protein MLP_50740 [Microlunatus phosphovorus NM-1]
MFAYQQQLVSCYVSVDQYEVSRHASQRFERLQALRERRAERRRRADRRSQESYTTAV